MASQGSIARNPWLLKAGPVCAVIDPIAPLCTCRSRQQLHCVRWLTAVSIMQHMVHTSFHCDQNVHRPMPGWRHSSTPRLPVACTGQNTCNSPCDTPGVHSPVHLVWVCRHIIDGVVEGVAVRSGTEHRLAWVSRRALRHGTWHTRIFQADWLPEPAGTCAPHGRAAPSPA